MLCPAWFAITVRIQRAFLVYEHHCRSAPSELSMGEDLKHIVQKFCPVFVFHPEVRTFPTWLCTVPNRNKLGIVPYTPSFALKCPLNHSLHSDTHFQMHDGLFGVDFGLLRWAYGAYKVYG